MYYIIPKYGTTNKVVFGCIGTHIMIVVVMQVLGTVRSVISFRMKKEAAAEERAEEILKTGQKFHPPNFTPFKWTNTANLAAIASLAVETIQIAIFSMQALQPQPTVDTSGNVTTPPVDNAFVQYMFLSFTNFFTEHAHEVYGWTCVALALLLLSVFLVQFMLELRMFAVCDVRLLHRHVLFWSSNLFGYFVVLFFSLQTQHSYRH
jgi:hypothetical protein